jgi:hypothetical protein
MFDGQCGFKKPKLPEVVANKMQNNGSHLNSGHFQIFCGI